ncbi:hypothetical protein CC2G_014954 [Coprinopsis cinerea AmutBmut pab1-1]|nr:hypothetical protein CC2G_014954 [Coprinopsis cinerea AmutBmut pab1-1]
MQLGAEDTSSIELLCSLAAVDTETARRVFHKHGGDMNKAAEALLGGDKGEDHWSTQVQRHNTPESSYYENAPGPPIQVTPAPAGSEIDLTGESDPYQTIPAASFGPSNRAPDPNWQMVPSNLAVSSTPAGISQEDQSLNDAIAASLNDFKSEEKDTFELTQHVREGGRPVALRPESPSLACAALVVQALYHVPQVRAAVAQIGLPDVPSDVALSHSVRAVWNLVELFTNMDLAQLAVIVDVEVLPSLVKEEEMEKTGDNPSDRAAAMLNNLGGTLEEYLSARTELIPLFNFTHVNVELINRLPRKVSRTTIGGIVKIEFDGTENDLIQRLSSILSRYEEGKSSHDVIVDPSQMLAFNLSRHVASTGTTQRKADAVPLNYPKTFYLDRFMFRNLELANRKKAQEQQYQREIQDLTSQREALTTFDGRDAIQDLKNSIYYYEKVAHANGDQARQQTLDYTVNQLKDVLTMVESKVEGIDRRIQELEALAADVYNVPELQQFRYDLRAVLMHTGLPGRKQMYSYVQDVEGVWWKTCDYEVTEVTEETVLTDPAGLHLSAGPFLLLYSMHLSDEELRRPVQWPEIFAVCISFVFQRSVLVT